MNRIRVIGSVLALLNLAFAVTVSAAQPEAETSASLQRLLEERFPGIKIDDIVPAQVPGLYEVFAGGRIVYVDKTGDYLLMGQLMDTRTRKDLTAQRVDERNAIDFTALPFERAIKVVKGNGRHKLAVFSDPDCPYCRELEQDLQSLTDFTAYIFLFPIASLHPEAPEKARKIWCSPDPAQAWTRWMIEEQLPAAKECTGDPLAELQTLGGNLRIVSTPTIFFESGRRLSGAPSREQLAALLRAPARTSAAAQQNGHTVQQ